MSFLDMPLPMPTREGVAFRNNNYIASNVRTPGGATYSAQEEWLLSPLSLEQELERMHNHAVMMHAYIEELRKMYVYLKEHRPEVIAEVEIGMAVANKLSVD